MRFDWDDANISHLAAHGVTPKEFEQAFRNHIRLYRAVHHRERRYVVLGETERSRVLTLIYTMRGRKIRAVTAHTAPRKQRKFYAEQKSTTR